MCVAAEEAVRHAGWKAPAWAMRWAAPTGTELCGSAVAAAVAARNREKERNNCSLRPRTLGSCYSNHFTSKTQDEDVTSRCDLHSCPNLYPFHMLFPA